MRRLLLRIEHVLRKLKKHQVQTSLFSTAAALTQRADAIAVCTECRPGARDDTTGFGLLCHST